MMIDIANVRDIGPEGSNHLPQAIASLRGIDGVRSQLGARGHSRATIFEVEVGNKVVIVWSSFATRVLHREERDFVTLRSQQVHEFEQVSFCAAK